MPRTTLAQHGPTGRATQPLTANQYLAALRRLGLTPASQKTADLLGLTVRQCQKIKDGQSPVTGQLERLLSMYLKHGLPKE